MKNAKNNAFEIGFTEGPFETVMCLVVKKPSFNVSDVMLRLTNMRLMQYTSEERIREIKKLSKKNGKGTQRLAGLPDGVTPPRKIIKRINATQIKKGIFFEGDLKILCDISRGCCVQATGKISMLNNKITDGAEVSAHGDILVGAIEKSNVICDGKLHVVNSIYHSNVAARKGVYVSHDIIMSHVVSGERVTVEGNSGQTTGMIISGRILGSVVVNCLTGDDKWKESYKGLPTITLDGIDKEKYYDKFVEHLNELRLYLTQGWA